MTSAIAATLPYGPILSRLLRPVQRTLNVVNRVFAAPLLRCHLGWLLATPLTGSLLLLRTRGHRTGRRREAPLGYVIRDGAVYCVAGYGVATPWYRNLLAEPAVTVILPTRRITGLAEPVADDAEWASAFRSLIGAFGVVGRAVIGDIRTTSDPELVRRYRSLPVVRIRARDGRPIEPGPFDPGGRGWLLSAASSAAVIGAAIGTATRARARISRRRPGR